MRMPTFRTPPTALTIAGSDNSAGAGIQADLKTFSCFGVYGLTAVTCIVAEVPGAVVAIQPVERFIVSEQIELGLDYFLVGAIKTGMLYSSEIIEAVVGVLEEKAAELPLVVDPVMVASSGDRLLQNEAITLYRTSLIPRATLVTPNLDEAAVLLNGNPIRTVEEMAEAGRRLSAEYGTTFLMKGGHLAGGMAVDLLVGKGEIREYAAPRVEGVTTHGTGCSYSSAITALLALGKPLPEAVEGAKEFITAAIRESFQWTRADGVTTLALNHFAQRREEM